MVQDKISTRIIIKCKNICSQFVVFVLIFDIKGQIKNILCYFTTYIQQYSHTFLIKVKMKYYVLHDRK